MDFNHRLFCHFIHSDYSTVTDLAKFLGLSISQPFIVPAKIYQWYL